MKQNTQNFGHRCRVRKKFLVSAGEELQDYELLEILLFAANPRHDTKATAKKLIASFGNISGVINAEAAILKEINEVGEAAIVQIKVVSAIIKRVLKNSAALKPVLKNWEAILDYASVSLKNLNHEVFRVLFLNKKYQLLKDELFGTGENDRVFISSKAIAKKALILSAASVILLHNHPGGELRASTSDIAATNEIAAVLKNLQIRILDHLIITSEGYLSFRKQGLL
jgi:DNA repair protein RadC